MERRFKEPYQTFNEIEKLAKLGKKRYIYQEVVERGRSMRDVARELNCSPENISIILEQMRKEKLNKT